MLSVAIPQYSHLLVQLFCQVFVDSITALSTHFYHVMGKIKTIEYFRVLPRWLFVKITDEYDNYGWGEATLEGHSQAVEGCLDAMIQRFVGYEAE